MFKWVFRQHIHLLNKWDLCKLVNLKDKEEQAVETVVVVPEPTTQQDEVVEVPAPTSEQAKVVEVPASATVPAKEQVKVVKLPESSSKQKKVEELADVHFSGLHPREYVSVVQCQRLLVMFLFV